MLAVVLLAMATVALLSAARSWSTARGETFKAAESVAAAESLLSTVRDAETGQRGYLLTGDPAYLQPYQASRQVIDQRIVALERSAGGEVDSRSPSLAVLVRAKMSELAWSIGVYQSDGTAAALRVVQSGQGRVLMERITERIDEVRREAQKRTELRAGQEERRALVAISLAVAMSALTGAALAAGALITLRRDRALREQLEQEVAQRTSDLDATNRQLIQALDEKDRALADREQALFRARVAEQAKSRVLAAASHDLRQPLQALQLFLAALKERLPGDAEQFIVSRAAEALTAGRDVLDALADLSIFDAGLVKPAIEAFPVATILDALHGEFAPAAHEKGLRFSVVRSHRLVLSDRILLTRLMRSLVSNAIRYTESGGILIGCRRRGPSLAVTVIDTGPGIPPTLQEAVFEDFYSIANLHRDRRQGLGLGLSVARRIALLLHHQISMRSEPDRGTCLAIIVPLAKTESEREAGESYAGESLQPG